MSSTHTALGSVADPALVGLQAVDHGVDRQRDDQQPGTRTGACSIVSSPAANSRGDRGAVRLARSAQRAAASTSPRRRGSAWSGRYAAQSPAQVAHRRCGVHRRPSDEGRTDGLAPLSSGAPDHDGLGHPGQRGERVLDEPRRHLEAAGGDHVVEPPVDVPAPGRASRWPASSVRNQRPPVLVGAERLGRQVRSAEVAGAPGWRHRDEPSVVVDPHPAAPTAAPRRRRSRRTSRSCRRS